MKKLMKTMAAVLCCTMTMTVQTACTNEDNPAKPCIGKASITIETKALYDELGMTDVMTQTLAKGSAFVTDTVLIYDQTGALVSKLGTESSNLQPLKFNVDALPNGTYTLVGWQSIRGSRGDRCWTTAGEEQLSTLNISTIYQIINETWALGVAKATVTIDGGMIEATVTPKAMGSIIDAQVEGDAEYEDLRLYVLNEWTYGCYLDPNRAEEDSWMTKTDNYYAAVIARMRKGTTTDKFFTLCHGDDMSTAMWNMGGNGSKYFVSSDHMKMHAGDYKKYYLNLDRTSYQPPFFGSVDDFAAWKADRDAGILVVDPCVKFGCNIDEVEQHVSKKQWWRKSFDKLRYWDAMAAWYMDYRIAENFREEYIFKTENGEDLFFIYCVSPDITVEMANNTLLKQGYVYNGKIKFPEYDVRDLFFSADGQIEVQTFVANGYTQMFYQPTDPEDFQYIVK